MHLGKHGRHSGHDIRQQGEEYQTTNGDHEQRIIHLGGDFLSRPELAFAKIGQAQHHEGQSTASLPSSHHVHEELRKHASMLAQSCRETTALQDTLAHLDEGTL